MLDEVRDDQPHAASAQGSGDTEEDRAVCSEHFLPDGVGGREASALERHPLHSRQHVVGPEPRFDHERLDRYAQEARLVGHAA
jgi:hypothetical protein